VSLQDVSNFPHFQVIYQRSLCCEMILCSAHKIQTHTWFSVTQTSLEYPTRMSRFSCYQNFCFNPTNYHYHRQQAVYSHSFRHFMAHLALLLAYSKVNIKSNGDKASPCFRHYTNGMYQTGVYLYSHVTMECMSKRGGYAIFENFDILVILVHVT